MREFYSAWEHWVAIAAISAVVILSVAILAYAAVPEFRRLTAACKMDRWSKLLAAPLVVMLCLHGMTKSGGSGRVTYPSTDADTRYLVDNGSYVTNDYVHVDFTRSALVPDSADLLGYYRPVSSTNDADWVEFLSTTFAAFTVPQDISFANAISNNFCLFTSWTPGPTVHTNGVALVIWQNKYDPERDINVAAMIRTGVYTNSVRIAPNPAITNSLRAASQLMQSNNEEAENDE